MVPKVTEILESIMMSFFLRIVFPLYVKRSSVKINRLSLLRLLNISKAIVPGFLTFIVHLCDSFNKTSYSDSYSLWKNFNNFFYLIHSPAVFCIIGNCGFRNLISYLIRQNNFGQNFQGTKFSRQNFGHLEVFSSLLSSKIFFLTKNFISFVKF